MQLWSIDRISEGLAILENDSRQSKTIMLCILPPNVKEGDCLIENNNIFLLDIEQTKLRRSQNSKLFEELLQKD